ncbi:hypothetical protein CS063_14855 [Sporanaerobium hydrogeniformans]|uniref:Uncharacterized protein n=1 Tax=Sporanaerobium hydrogeniformans TaxID=3072179 RepID=A0AC61DAN6_9FIRM|nr:DUF1819 family protein [Sporanaerobium hydrogeniformans]PHV69587.1 hypothetical protein CS063_14855 [Sporanaerobium hydrogeniformans]
MEDKKYSAGGVKFSFWFAEFRKMIELLNEGYTFDEIKEKAINENLFLTPTQARAKQIYTTVSNRIKTLDKGFYQLFKTSDVSNQKLINVIAIMKSDQLFADFVYEVYREKLLIGIDELADSDIRIFFRDKQVQSEKVASWQDYTLKRLGAYYKTVLMEAGMIENSTSTTRKLIRPIMDKVLADHLLASDMKFYYDAVTGVR